VARIFATDPELKKFHRIFLSCNEPIENKAWCNRCEKCAFVFLILSAFLPPAEIQLIFGSNLFDHQHLIEKFRAIIGYSPEGHKPFECIGTAQESQAAVELSLHQYLTHCHPEDIEEVPIVLKDLCDCLGIKFLRHDDVETCDAHIDSVIQKWIKF
jgi:hypothetical protein